MPQISVMGVFLGLLAVFVVWRVAFATKLPKKHKAWVVPLTILTIVYGIGGVAMGMGMRDGDLKTLRPFITVGSTTLVVVGCMILCTFILMLVSVVWRMVGDTDSDDGDATRVKFLRWGTVASLIVSIAVVGWGYNQARTPGITQVSYSNSQIPSGFNGFSIALITDLHIGPTRSGEWLQEVVDQVNAEKPDLVVIAGDFVDGTPSNIGDELLPITQLNAPYGVYITTGNHEFYSGVEAWVDFWGEQGIKVLNNESVVIKRGAISFDLIGINDRTGREPYAPDLQAAVNSLSTWGVEPDDTSRFRILAAHQPLQATMYDGLAAQSGIDLQLSGHTHGGQIWPVHGLVLLQQPVIDGVHDINGVTVVTSRGAGAWGPPVRILADPEIVIVTLQSE